MESAKTNEGELTSTMGNLLSTSKEDKSDASDSTPTSSTDAFTTASTSQIAADDPISSTSSDVSDSKKSTENVSEIAQSSTIVNSDVMSSLKDMSMGDNSSPIVSEKDLLVMNITDTSTEKITENVDDIVQDLENLLGEPTTSFDFSLKSRNDRSSGESKDMVMDIDEFSAELQLLTEQSTEHKETVASNPDGQPNMGEPANATTDIVDTKVSMDPQEKKTEDPQCTEPSDLVMNSNDTVEKINNDQIENCQFEIISASSGNTESLLVAKSEFSEAQQVITSTDSKAEQMQEPPQCKLESSSVVAEVEENVLREEKDEVDSTKEESSVDESVRVNSEEVTSEVIEEVAVTEEPMIVDQVAQPEELKIEEKPSETPIVVPLESSNVVQEMEMGPTPETGSMQVEELQEVESREEEKTDASLREVEEEEAKAQIKVGTNLEGLGDVDPKEEIGGDVEPKEEVGGDVEPKEEIGGDVEPKEEIGGDVDPGKVELKEETKAQIEVGTNLEQLGDVEPKEEIEMDVNPGKAEFKEEIKVQIETATHLEEPKEEIGMDTNSGEAELKEETKAQVEMVTDLEELRDAEPRQEVENPQVEESKEVTVEIHATTEVVEVKPAEKVENVQPEELKSEEPTQEVVEIQTNSEEVKEVRPPQEQEMVQIEITEKEESMEVEMKINLEELKEAEPTKVETIEVKISMDPEEVELAQETGSVQVEMVTNLPELKEMEPPQEKVETGEIQGQEVEPTQETESVKVETSVNLEQTQPEVQVEQSVEQVGVIVEESKSHVAKPEEKPSAAEENENDKKIEVPMAIVEEEREIQTSSVNNEKVKSTEDTYSTPMESPTIVLEIDEPASAVTSSQCSAVEESFEQPAPVEIQVDSTEAMVIPIDTQPPPPEKIEDNSEASTSQKVEDVQLVECSETVSGPEYPEENAVSTGDILNIAVNIIPEIKQFTPTEVAEIPSESISVDPVQLQEIPVNATGEEPKLEPIETPSKDDVITPLDFIPEPVEIRQNTLAEDLDLLVQNTIADDSISLEPSLEEKNLQVSTSCVMENTMLPLPMEEVPDLDVLNAISTLSDNKENLIPDMVQDAQQSDALLSSSTLEQPSGDIPFEPSIETSLPTVDEIFAEPNQQQQVDLQDDNLETLLAVASLQNVDYIPPVEDFSSPVEQVPSFIPEETGPPVEEFPPIQEEEKIDEQPKLNEPLVINIDDSDKDKVYSPKITIKPIRPPDEKEVMSPVCDAEGGKGSLKMTITKQSDNMHSILKIYNPDDDNTHTEEEHTVPKLIIKQIVQPNEQPQSPKISTRSCKQVFSPSSSANQRSSSPRITIKPIPKPEEPLAPLKITIKQHEAHKQKHSPKLTIKPILKPDEETNSETKVHSPRVTIKPIVKPHDETEQISSPRITIKPIVKPVETIPEPISTPRVTIKPVIKHPEKDKEVGDQLEKSSPKITIKPIVKPPVVEPLPLEDFEESIKERIVLKINKGTIPGSSKDSRKRELPHEEEKLAKIKLKFSKEGGHPQIVQNQSSVKRTNEQVDFDKMKRQRLETEPFLPGITITPIGLSTHSKLKEMLTRPDISTHNKVVPIEDDDDDVTIVEETHKSSPIVISEESNQDSMAATISAASLNEMDLQDPISEIPVFEITPDSVKTLNPLPVAPVVEAPPPPAPRKRGRPRKVPLEVREDFKDPKEEEPKPVLVRPKRSCRGQSVRTTLGIKPRKPRGPGRGRGSKRGVGTRGTPTPPETPPRAAKEPKLKLKELKEDSFLLSVKSEVKFESDDGFQNSLLAPPQSDTSTTDRADIVMYEEETRMSAETNSRAQTPAKQVVTTIPTVDLVEESQSSVQSTATTESVKVRRGPRLEVHQEPEGAVISADQLAEYYWSGGGPFMLQEQVAQFLGIKSFKRKYPNIQRRVVDMQERDFIRESGLAGEAMCDLGLTAVNSSDILDIMYSDFQDKYEEYCKHQRDRQTKDLINKQKALSLAASQEKAKMDITQQAVQSAASWNATFNKARRDQRKSCMDLQTLTIHFPKGKMKQIGKPKIGYYPVALVPGQFTDYYREFTPTEINNLPLNTLCYDPIIRANHHEMECDSQTDGSGSESDSSSSDSDSSYSGSSDGEDCTLCKHAPKRVAAVQ